MKERWQSAALVALMAMVFGYILGQSRILPVAQAQGEGAAGRVICVVGTASDRTAPIVLVDTLEQSIIVYEYNYTARSMYLKTARSYRFDRLLVDFHSGGGLGPSVEEVRRMMEGR